MTGFNCKDCSISNPCSLHDPYGNEEILLLRILKSLGTWRREPQPPPLWTLPVIPSDPSAPHPPTSYLHYCPLKNNQLVLCSNPWDCTCGKLEPLGDPTGDRNESFSTMGSKEPRGNSRKSIAQLAKQLRNNCDKIFDSSIPFVVELSLLRKVIDAVDSLTSEASEEDSLEWRDLVLFLSDVCSQTPSLCISSFGAGGASSSSSSSINGANSSSKNSEDSKDSSTAPQVNLGLFKSLSFLELRNTPVSKVNGLVSIRHKLKRAKCSRCISNLSQLFGRSENSSSSVPAVWPELKDVDLSLNFISGSLGPEDVDLFTLLPSVEVLNLSRNRISSIDSSFSRGLNALCVLNLSYNQLTHVPPIPPTVEQLYLSHNYISTLTSPSNHGNNSRPPVSKFTLSSSVLKNLKVLDLSTNLLAREEELGALMELGALEKLNLMGNPISFLENYRNIVAGYLHRWVVSRKFELDRKSLSSSEVRWGIERAKEGKFVPYVPANSLMISQAMSSSAFGAVPGGSGYSGKPGRLGSNVKSLTQSYDSSTSSVRSSRRKKAKIREIVEAKEEDCEEERQRDNKRPGSRITLQRSESEVNTRQAVAALREKYGAEHWLLTQAGGELEKLLHIPARQQAPLMTDMFSRSLPHNSRHGDNNSVSNLSNLSNLSTTPKGGGGYYGSPKVDSFLQPSSIEDDTACEEFYSCFSENSSLQVDSDPQGNLMETSGNNNKSIFDSSAALHVDEKLDASKLPGEVLTFSVFQAGEVLKLVIHDGYLIHTDGDFIVQCKWDLNCLTSLEEERCDSETESVEFRLKFDTMRKQMRERSFIMGKKDFRRFDAAVSPFIEAKALEEFTEALQCTKCYAQFSRAMAKTTVKVDEGRGGAPKEVEVCPTCDCDVLVTLDAIPLPNNECLDLDDVDVRKGPLRTSTPVSVSRGTFGGRASASLGRSIPKPSDERSSKSPRIIEFLRQLPSSLTFRSRPSPSPQRHQLQQNFQGDSLEDEEDDDDGGSILRLDKSNTPSSSDTVPNTKSDSQSDIEVLSNDSSSIEVLAKQSCGESSASSDVEAEEALEVPMYEGTNHNLSRTVVMSESTSSSSCADSIVTTYERQHQHPQYAHLSGSSSLASTSTITSKPSPKAGRRPQPIPHSTVPIRYDYVNFGRTDHRLQLWSEISVFKSADERLLALVKCVVICDASPGGCFLGIVIFSSKKMYIFRIHGHEGDKPQDWLQKVNSFDLSKFAKLDVLIGRHGVGVDFSGKYFAFVFRDSDRTSSFLEYFMSDICGELNSPPVVRDFSQTQKTMLSPTNPITYFGILRLVQCESPENIYTISAILVTNEEALLITDLSWMAGCCDTVSTRHGRRLSDLRQVESMESEQSYLSLVFGMEGDQIVRWELAFETPTERKKFENCVRSEVKVACVHEIPFICLSQPLEP